MKRIVFAIFFLGLFNQLYSQEREITITVVDTCGKPLPGATVYLSNDYNIMTEPQLDLLMNNNWLHSRESNIESSITNFDGQVTFSNNKCLYAHAMLIGFQSKTISIDSISLNYTIELPERTYDFSALIISPKNFAIEWSTFERDYAYYFVEYRFKPNTFDTIGGMVYEVITPHTPENIIDSSWGGAFATFTYPENGTEKFFKNLATKLWPVRFTVIFFDFTVTNADSLRVNRIDGIDSMEYSWIKEMFINLDSWKSARPRGKKIAIRYRLKVIKSEKELTNTADNYNERTIMKYH